MRIEAILTAADAAKLHVSEDWEKFFQHPAAFKELPLDKLEDIRSILTETAEFFLQKLGCNVNLSISEYHKNPCAGIMSPGNYMVLLTGYVIRNLLRPQVETSKQTLFDGLKVLAHECGHVSQFTNGFDPNTAPLVNEFFADKKYESMSFSEIYAIYSALPQERDANIKAVSLLRDWLQWKKLWLPEHENWLGLWEKNAAVGAGWDAYCLDDEPLVFNEGS